MTKVAYCQNKYIRHPTGQLKQQNIQISNFEQFFKNDEVKKQGLERRKTCLFKTKNAPKKYFLQQKNVKWLSKKVIKHVS